MQDTVKRLEREVSEARENTEAAFESLGERLQEGNEAVASRLSDTDEQIRDLDILIFVLEEVTSRLNSEEGTQ